MTDNMNGNIDDTLKIGNLNLSNSNGSGKREDYLGNIKEI